MSKPVLALSLAATVLAAVAVNAVAHDASYNSNVRIDVFDFSIPDEMHVKGRVKAGSAACEKGRKVRLFLNHPKAGPQPLGSDKTNAAGRWTIQAEPEPHPYQARVFKTQVGGAGHKHVCKPDRSKPLVLP